MTETPDTPGEDDWGGRFQAYQVRLASAWQWLGLEGIVLLAALLCDLSVVFPAAFDNTGPKGRDLLLLPGIFAISGCALWARKRPTEAAFAGAGVLFASTLLISATDASAYSTLLNDISLSETVAGLELVFFCVSQIGAGTAFAAVSSLVAGALFATIARGHRSGFDNRELVSLLVGATLLTAAVAAGLRFRQNRAPEERSALSRLLRTQWPLTGMLCLPLFLELYQALDHGPSALPLLVCSAAAAGTAILATRHPVPAAVALTGVILVTGFADLLTYVHGYGEPLPPTEVLAGLVVVVYLVRYARSPVGWSLICALSAAVGTASLVNVLSPRGVIGGTPGLRFEASAALLLLGIAVATGLYFRARDSERTQAVEAAVTEAQTSERMALARELHDVVAHHVTGIVVQAQAAKMAGAQNPALAMDALDRIEQAGTDALTAMRRLVRSMRAHTEDTQQATTELAADLRRLIDAGHHGVPTEVDLRLPADIPHEVGRSALRVIQESLTNVGKHAEAATLVRVLAEVEDRELHIRVGDNGRAGGAKRRRTGDGTGGWRVGGYGLVGMRERVELLHGRLTAGPDQDGWLVEAWLPLDETPTV
ncbi:MAG TPA: histidine kinase [Amycolatopsis sp.]|nr:histidine kinase [Amycolatopsis sp.]